MAFALPIRFGVISLLSAMAASAATKLPADLGIYDWRCSISGSFETGMVYRARLTPEVFDGFLSFPLDLRVVDRNGSNWPSLVWSRTDRAGISPVRHTLLNRSDIALDPSFAVKEFLVEPGRDGSIPVHNRVIVQSGTSEFVRRVEVWAGPHSDKLVLLGSGFLIEQKVPAPVRNRAIDYPDSRWPFVVVRVFHDARQPEADLDWKSTEIVRVDRDDADHESISLKRTDVPAGEAPMDGVAIIYLDTGAKNRPMLYVSFESDATEFAIPVRVFGRNSDTNKWRWVADGGIHHLGGHEQNRISLAKSDYRFLKLEFYHYAQKPPKIKNITGAYLPHYLVFEAKSNQKPYLFFGAPRYDLGLANPLRRMDVDSIPEEMEVTLSKRHTNPLRVAGTLSDYRNTLMRFGLGVVMLLVAIFVVRIIRHRYF